MTEATQLTDTVAVHGEGPCWDAYSQRLLWVDMFAGTVLSTDPETGETDRVRIDGPVAAFVRPTAGGRSLVVAGERSIQLIEPAGVRTWAKMPLSEGVRVNEGGCDPQGRLYVGTMTYDCAPDEGAIYRVADPSLIEEVVSRTTISNGLDWSPSGETAYFVDSAHNRIDRLGFDAEQGIFESREVFTRVDQDDGIPDGLCVDAEGHVWVALWGTGTVRRYNSNGTPSGGVRVDCLPVTGCAFGGEDLSVLYVTTSRFEDPYKTTRGAGAVFASRPGVSGLPVREFTIPEGS